MNDSALARFFGVAVRSQTWLGVLFHLLAFPLGLFYFIFLTVGLALGVGLVVVWVGIPILLVVAGAWWLFAAFERLLARWLLGADVPPAPREWERAEGIWAKLKAHFGSASTWKDLAYLIAKLAFGVVSFMLVVVLFAMVGWFLAVPLFAMIDAPVIMEVHAGGGASGTWVPPLWFGAISIPLGVLWFFVSLHVINAWGWVCRHWAELMFREPASASPLTSRSVVAAPGVAPQAPPPAAEAPPAPPADDETTS